MKFRSWFATRGPKYIVRRAMRLLSRYDITPHKAQNRITHLVETMLEYGCVPTFTTPAVVVQAYPRFFRDIQQAGVEIAVHGLHHVDLTAYPVKEASRQLIEAARIFAECGIEVHGFRNPYLCCSDELVDALPAGHFSYGSNRAIYWDIVPINDTDLSNCDLMTLRRLYNPEPATDRVCVPRKGPNIIEVPVCLPDDLMLHDALSIDSEFLEQPWNRLLDEIYRRGELFSLLFHPELGDCCQQGFAGVLDEARKLNPPVWITKLCDIGDWWQEKSNFGVDISSTSTGLRIAFHCTPRATILSRGIALPGRENSWNNGYDRAPDAVLYAPAEPRPFVGLPATTPEYWVAFLQEQGYILDLEETATRCALYIDPATLSCITSEVQLIDMIEASPGPLVRYWRWPDGAKCAMCISGDLDALTILDYVSRLFIGSHPNVPGRGEYEKRLSPSCTIKEKQ